MENDFFARTTIQIAGKDTVHCITSLCISKETGNVVFLRFDWIYMRFKRALSLKCTCTHSLLSCTHSFAFCSNIQRKMCLIWFVLTCTMCISMHIFVQSRLLSNRLSYWNWVTRSSLQQSSVVLLHFIIIKLYANWMTTLFSWTSAGWNDGLILIIE